MKRSDDLANITRKLIYQGKENEKCVQKLDNANIELKFQREEKKKRTEEIVVANIEFVSSPYIQTDQK